MILKELLYKIVRPISHEWVFFMMCFLLMGKLLVRALLYIPVNGLPETSWLYNFGEVFIFAYFLTFLVYKINSRSVKFFFYILLFVVFFIREFLKFVFIMEISPEVLMLVTETTPREVSEFFHEYLFTSGTCYAVTITLLLSFVAIIVEKYRKQFGYLFKGRIMRVVFSLLLVWGLIACLSYVRMYKAQTMDELSVWQLDESQYADPFSLLLCSTYSLELSSGDMARFVQVTQQVTSKQVSVTYTDSLNIVIVIGESYIKWHSNLYGYPLNTCPYQKTEVEEGRLFALNAVYTSSNYTSTALKNILSCNNSIRGEQWNEFPYFPSIMKHAGYQVYLWDNQREAFEYTAFTFSLNSFLYDSNIQQLSYTKVNDCNFDYDADLIADLEKHIGNKGRHNLFMIHLMGQHFDAKKRFPHPSFSVFQGKDIPNRAVYMTESKRQEVADYDNATLYNDYVLKKIMDLFRKEPAVIIYFSDHGEEIYDYRDSKGRADAESQTETMYWKYQYQIPFTIWCSDKYIEKNPEQVKAIKGCIDNSWMTDDLCHLVFRIGGITTSYYKKDRDVLDSLYREENNKTENLAY